MMTVRVRKHERGLMFRHGEFVRVLGPGVHRLWGRVIRGRRETIEVVSTLEAELVHPLLESIVRDPVVRAELAVVELAGHQRALVWKHGRLVSAVGPGVYAFWNAPARVQIETFDATVRHFLHPRLDAILAHAEARLFLHAVEVEPHMEALLFVNDKPAGWLAPGRHAFWKGTDRVRFVLVDRREQAVQVTGQEVTTADRAALRLNLSVTLRVFDAAKAATVVRDYARSVCVETQGALRAAVAARTLDALLADKESVADEVRRVLSARAREFGVEVRGVGLRDIILPADMNAILNTAIEALRRAEAELIWRREEATPAQSPATAARLLAVNPVLGRLKELESLQQSLNGTKATFAFGPGDGVNREHAAVVRPEEPGD